MQQWHQSFDAYNNSKKLSPLQYPSSILTEGSESASSSTWGVKSMVKKTLFEWVAGNGGSKEHGVSPPHQEHHNTIQYLPTRMPTLSHVVSANSRGAIVRMHRTTLEKSDMLAKEQREKGNKRVAMRSNTHRHI